MIVWRWQNHYRWYQAELHYDLFGSLLLTKKWGGLNNKITGSKTQIVNDLLTGMNMLNAIDKQRLKRKNPYYRIDC